MAIIIGPDLCPAVQIGEAFVSVFPTTSTDYMGKPKWEWRVILPGGETYEERDLCGWSNARGMLGTLLSFLEASAESHRYRIGKGETEVDPDGNEGLFPPAVVEWAYQNSDEIGMVRIELEETEDD